MTRAAVADGRVGWVEGFVSTAVALCAQEAEYQRAMQRRAIRDAKTPEKMKQAKPVVDDSLTLQGKKDKIKSNLQRLAELGKVHPENRYQDLINDIAKVKPAAPPVDAVTCCMFNRTLALCVWHRTSGTRDGTGSAGKPSW